MKKEKEIRLSRKMWRAQLLITFVTMLFLLSVACWLVNGGMKLENNKLEAVVFAFPIWLILFAVIQKSSDRIEKYEDEERWANHKKERINEQIIYFSELLSLSESEMRSAIGGEISAEMTVNDMKLEFKIPPEDIMHIRKIIEEKKVSLRKEISELTIPEKPKMYIFWEKILFSSPSARVACVC